MGLVEVLEPFANLFTQGMITYQGAKMSKSRGNVISPSMYVERYGADTARCYILFLGPPQDDADWSDEGVGGVHRFLGRVWRVAVELSERMEGETPQAVERLDASRLEGDSLALARKAHWAIDKVTEDIERRFRFNTALSAVMELVNDIYRLKEGLRGDQAGEEVMRFSCATVASLLFPFAPHIGAEVYELITSDRIWEADWPEADPRLLERDRVPVVIQVNGKVRDRIEVDAGAAEDEVKRMALERPNVQRHLDGKQVVKEIVVPGKLVNFVVR
jgi:leucyl-tRNA synthetase